MLAATSIALLAACGGAPDNGTAPANAPAPAANGANEAAPTNLNAAGAPVATPDATEAAGYLPPPGTYSARAMALAPPVEAQALNARMVQALGRNPAWAQAYLAEHASGHMPWHPNLGISEAEFARYLELVRRIGLSERGRVSLTVARRPDGGLTLTATGPATALNGIILYPERSRIESPLGGLAMRAAAGNDDESSPFGRWRGVAWTNRGSGSSRPVSLTFGRRGSNEMILFYDYGPTDAETVILLYPGPAAPAAGG